MKLLTQKDVAEMFQTSQATISRMACAGQIPHVVLRTGRRKNIIRFRPEDVERWLRERTHGGPKNQRSKQKQPPNGNGMVTEKTMNAEVQDTKRENDGGHGISSHWLKHGREREA